MKFSLLNISKVLAVFAVLFSFAGSGFASETNVLSKPVVLAQEDFAWLKHDLDSIQKDISGLESREKRLEHLEDVQSEVLSAVTGTKEWMVNVVIYSLRGGIAFMNGDSEEAFELLTLAINKLLSAPTVDFEGDERILPTSWELLTNVTENYVHVCRKAGKIEEGRELGQRISEELTRRCNLLTENMDAEATKRMKNALNDNIARIDAAFTKQLPNGR